MLENKIEAKKYLHKAFPYLTDSELNRLIIILEGMWIGLSANRNKKTA